MASLVKNLHLIDSEQLFFWRTHGGSDRPAAGRRVKPRFTPLTWSTQGGSEGFGIGPFAESCRAPVGFGSSSARHSFGKTPKRNFNHGVRTIPRISRYAAPVPRVSRPPGSFPGPTRWCLEGWKPSGPAVRTAKGSRRVEVIDDWTKGTGRTVREFRPMGMPSVGESAARSGQPVPAASARRPEHSFGESHLHVRTWRLAGHGGERDGVPS